MSRFISTWSYIIIGTQQCWSDFIFYRTCHIFYGNALRTGKGIKIKVYVKLTLRTYVFSRTRFGFLDRNKSKHNKSDTYTNTCHEMVPNLQSAGLTDGAGLSLMYTLMMTLGLSWFWYVCLVTFTYLIMFLL